MTYRLISFTTDYGTRDGFVAACHGTMLWSAPHVSILDVTHEIPPGDVRGGALVLAQTVPYLPESIHVAVVDPGVGTNRRAIAIEAPRGVLIGPDNGLLPWAADALGGVDRAVELTESRWHREPVSRTFHGRDVFGPVAAAVATGTALTSLGGPIDPGDLVRLPDPLLSITANGLTAEVIAIDRFGNVQTAAPGSAATGLAQRLLVNGTAAKSGETFGSVETGKLVVLVDSADRVTIARNGGSAAESLDVRIGDMVRLTAAD
ncbi:SAM hydrolase/SAM-dependent halogenase family protein [Stackebrandtia soli]|uniref:SAM hydrolase/SAM-dependent halogenase family protein n=1 Tax=Stackebrandtia soli TaxID=1892856 RepID=UPI0039EC6C8D